ncbi:MAG: hypothetical protein EP318_13930 [Rhodobacteraceae bacterium]|nr:MAG: hypothetical protein EP318_13930 [Paracoccaceae bacterium]
MPRLIVLALAAIFAAAGVIAATDDAIFGGNDVVMEIEVSADRLAECRQTLRDVAGMPVVNDEGSAMLFHDTSDLPRVVCVVR